MLIKRNQLLDLNFLSYQEFKQKSVVFLESNFKIWYDKRSKEQILSFIDNIIEFGKKYNLQKEISYQKLMYLTISYNLEFQNMKVHAILKSNTFNENEKIRMLLKLYINP